jgi:hypothetical protein
MRISSSLISNGLSFIRPGLWPIASFVAIVDSPWKFGVLIGLNRGQTAISEIAV